MLKLDGRQQSNMLPILFHLGPLSISAFGFFLAISLLLASFLVWRVSKVYDLNEEKIIDLILLTFLVSLVGARIINVLFNFTKFNSLEKVVLINRYPGLSFWGGLVFGLFGLYLLTKKNKLNFWLVADIASVATVFGLIFGSFGCLLAGCQYGVLSSSSLAVDQLGIVGKRYPVQVLFSLAFFLAFLILWRMCLKFHFAGKVLAFTLIILGLIKLGLSGLRGDTMMIYGINLEQVLSLLCLISGVVFYYRLGPKTLTGDLALFAKVLLNSHKRQIALLKFYKYCYNLNVNFRVFVLKSKAKIFKSINVKSNPTKF